MTGEEKPSIEDSLPENKLPNIYHYCVAFYDAMFEKSDSYAEGIYYKGYLKEIHEDAEIPLGYRDKVWKRLQKLGSIDREFRGGGATPSTFKLLNKPNPVTWERNAHNNRERSGSARYDQLQQRVNNITDRLVALETEVDKMRRWERNRRSNED